MQTRMRILSILSSSNQMYSGIGRAVFELSDRLRDRVQFEFAIDDRDERNLNIVKRFAEPRGLTVHVGRGRKRDECLDFGNDDLEELMGRAEWDAVECNCWANSDTNESVLRQIGTTTLIYTPHDQPAWTVPMDAIPAGNTERIHQGVVRRADVVLCDSIYERIQIQARAPGKNSAAFVPLGCDFRLFEAGGLERKQQLVFVGDLAEPRKRFDRVIGLLESLRVARPELRLVVIGNRSESAIERIPESLRPACDLLGYIDEESLRRVYRESLGLILLSDYEAFGIPLLEALASGTPVFLSDIAPTRSLFASFRGAHFCPPEDASQTFEIVERALKRTRATFREVLTDRPRLEARFGWDGLADKKWQLISSAWTYRNRFRWSA
jgi:D-inositol-3-phosphate glycosyltransferase